MNWGAYYKRLREVAASYKLPVYEEGQAIDIANLSNVMLKVQSAREWFVQAHAHANEHLAESRRKMVHLKHERKTRYNVNLAMNETVLACKTKEQRAALANAMCAELDERIADCESVIIDWNAALASVEQYLGSMETAKVTLGRIQRMVTSELEQMKG